MADFGLYAGHWIALTETNEVASVGITCEDARCTAHTNRPKEHLRLAWVSPHPPHVLIPEWPLNFLSNVLPKSGLWLAGGPVRDLLLGRQLHDWDFAVAEHAMSLARNVADALDAAYYPLDKERDTGRTIAKDPGTQRLITLDFAALRGKTIEEDLRLRDFTINAMAMTLEGEVIDPTGGQKDLKRKLIRATSEHTFTDDPVRLLRAIRQAGELDFNLEPQTRAAIRTQAAAIHTVAPERVRTELCNMLDFVPAARCLRSLKDSELLDPILPEIQALTTIEQSWPHDYTSAWEHTLAVITAVEDILLLLKGKALLRDKAQSRSPENSIPVPGWTWSILADKLTPLQPALLEYVNETVNVDMPRTALLKWGALFHDVGKATTCTVDEDGLTHYYGHAEAGAALTQTHLEMLRFPNKALTFVRMLVQAHMRLISMIKTPPTRRAVYRFYRATGDAGVGVILLALADTIAVWGRKLQQAYWHKFLNHAHILLKAYFEQRSEVISPPHLLNGRDLIGMGIPQGPEIGRILEMLYEAQAAGEITTREAAEVFVHTQSA